LRKWTWIRTLSWSSEPVEKTRELLKGIVVLRSTSLLITPPAVCSVFHQFVSMYMSAYRQFVSMYMSAVRINVYVCVPSVRINVYVCSWYQCICLQFVSMYMSAYHQFASMYMSAVRINVYVCVRTAYRNEPIFVSATRESAYLRISCYIWSHMVTYVF